MELVSSGGTATAIAEAGIPVTAVDDVTGFRRMLDHRVVTLHPKIHGGILADRCKPSHLDDMDDARHRAVRPGRLATSTRSRESPGIETIDIGGPAMTRAAAKNHAFVTIVTEPDAVRRRARASSRERQRRGRRHAPRARARSVRAHRRVRRRDRRVAVRATRCFPGTSRSRSSAPSEPLRYGENPHQHAARYRIAGTTSWWDDVTQHAGLALVVPQPLRRRRRVAPRARPRRRSPACAIIKHANPCGVAVAADLATAYQRALECDERSAFGGIVAFNRPVDAATVERMVAGPQADVVIAPGYDDGTIEALRKKRKNTRLLEAVPPEPITLDFRQICGGFLVQDAAPLRGRPRRLARRHQARADRRGVARRRARVAHRAGT